MGRADSLKSFRFGKKWLTYILGEIDELKEKLSKLEKRLDKLEGKTDDTATV